MKYISSLLIFLSLILVGCTGDEPNPGGGEIQTDKNFPDPEETVTVSLYKYSDLTVDGIYIDAADKFTSNNGWLFTSLGEMKGLGNISQIPWQTWSSSVPVKKGYGYIAYSTRENKFYRLFISNSASDEMGTITGYQVKYQKPYYGADEAVTFEAPDFPISYKGGPCFITFTNKSLIPVYTETDCDWIKVTDISYGFYDGCPYLSFDVAPTFSLSPSVGHIKVKTYNDKETIITVNREAVVPWEVTTSILDLKRKYWTNADNYATVISQSTIIRGIVVSSDEAGNIFKQIVIDDGSAAISLSINQYNLYLNFPYGQEVAFDLNGLYIGRYQGLMQVGDRSTYNSSYGITFAPLQDFAYQIIGEPLTVTPVSTTLSALHEALFNQSELLKWQSRYIKLTNIEFDDVDVPLASYHEDKSLLIRDESGLQIELKTSGYCTFFSEKTPKGVGDISGIISYYNGKWQLILNKASDIGTFDPNKTFKKEEPTPDPNPTIEPAGDGTEASPYNCARVIELNNPGTLNWVEGYIVGYMDYYTPVFYTPATTSSMVLIADSEDITDINHCVPVQLSYGTEIRNIINLKENLSMFHKKVQILGSLEQYFSRPGLKSTTSYKIL